MTSEVKQPRILHVVIASAQMLLSGWVLLGCGAGANSIPNTFVPEGRLLSPAKASVEQASSQSFAIEPLDVNGAPVSWRLEPSIGTITQDGLYTAPDTVTDQQNITVTANSKSSSVASAVVTLTPATIPATFMGLNVGDTYHRSPTFSFGTLATNAHVSWPLMNPAHGIYNFDALDQLLSYAQAHRSELLLILSGTPRWAASNPDESCADGPGTCAPPSDIKYWDDFLTAIAAHTKGQPGIKWAVWNEAQDPRYWTGSVPGMVLMAQHAWTILKASNSSAQIVSPSITGFPNPGPQWLSSYLAAGGGKYADIIGFHGYSTAIPEDVLPVVAAVQGSMRLAGLGSMPLWNTEGDWAGPGNIGQPAQADQDAYIPRYFATQWAAGVSRVVWYEYDGGNPWGGLVTGTNFAETSAAKAYAETYRWLVGSSVSQPCTKSTGNVWTCVFKSNGLPSTIVWSDTTQKYNVPLEYLLSRDLTGTERLIVNHKVDISTKPTLLEVLPLMLQKQ